MNPIQVWHGVYSGYYLSLGSVPFVLAVEDVYDRVLRRRLPKRVGLTVCLALYYLCTGCPSRSRT